MSGEQEKQIERLNIAGIILEVSKYLKTPDIIEMPTDGEIPPGYKQCGKCRKVMKLYLFNVNNESKIKCTGNCKACQKQTAAASYEKTKGNRNYKKYYAENKEKKQEHSRKYYEEHKDEIKDKQKNYHQSKTGKKVMQKAHSKRRGLLASNKGIKYERVWIIDRDLGANGLPVCYLCGKPIQFDRDIHLDHVVPVVLGGKDCFTNIACTHNLCNLRREKDARRLEVEQVEEIIRRAEQYIDKHPELFA